jgi:hypothetical protein
VRAVDGVYHPGRRPAGIAHAALLAEKRVPGKRARQRSDDQVLAGAIRLADEILHALLVDDEASPPAEIIAPEVSGVAGDRLRHAQAEIEV